MAQAARRTRRAGLERSAPLFAALGDETRLALVQRMSAGGPMSISRLTRGLAISRQATAKHLRVLEGAGLARGVRAGRESRWQLDPQPLEEARRSLARISTEWDRALARLRRLVEES